MLFPSFLLNHQAINTINIMSATSLNGQLAKRQFFLNEIVFAHVTGYAPWPAFVRQIAENKIEVVFNSQNVER